MPEIKRPRKGSLAYWPRKRARRIYPRLKGYPSAEKAKLMGFAGYKAGMLQAILIDNRKTSPTFGQEIVRPATVLDCPPLLAVGVRAYTATAKGLKVFTEAWSKKLPKHLSRKINTKNLTEKNLGKIESSIDKVSSIRLIVCTQPKLSGIGKKTPELFEMEIGGKDTKEKFELAKQMLGKEIKASDVVREGELVDIITITKGKGTAGPVKRFGIKIQPAHAKGKRRHTGSLGQERPGKVRPTVPMAGQLGFARRTELNKRVLKMGEGKEITPKSGFTRYGTIKGDYVLIEGSVPGPKKRLIMLRLALHPTKLKLLIPQIKEIVK